MLTEPYNQVLDTVNFEYQNMKEEPTKNLLRPSKKQNHQDKKEGREGKTQRAYFFNKLTAWLWSLVNPNTAGKTRRLENQERIHVKFAAQCKGSLLTKFFIPQRSQFCVLNIGWMKITHMMEGDLLSSETYQFKCWSQLNNAFTATVRLVWAKKKYKNTKA